METEATKDAQQPHLLSKRPGLSALEAGTSQGWKQAVGLLSSRSLARESPSPAAASCTL